MAQNETVDKMHVVIEEILNQLKLMNVSVNEETKQMIQKVVSNLLEKGILPKETLGFNPMVLEKIYFHAYNLFQAGKYKDSLLVFELLNNLDPYDVRFCFAAGACYHYSKDYLKAAGKYIECTTLDPVNPIPYFHLYDCFMHTDHLMSAFVAINQMMNIIGDNPDYQTLKDKAQLEINFLEDHLKKHLKEKYEAKD
ncbi:MAG: SycD/LcrH family type III secretion system chaperone [Parachlamydiaceae bacterium]|nr:SycD/LcrH family type III secretion system chaperone [Parachlamydiaceae bacterium]